MFNGMPGRMTVTDCFDLSRHYTFAVQAGVAKYGCGPVAVGIIKELLKGKQGEGVWQNLLKGEEIHDQGTQVDYLVKLLDQEPAVKYTLTKTNRTGIIRSATHDKPVIISWKFNNPYNGVAGHFNICIGPSSKAKPGYYVILDSAFGLNYIILEDHEKDGDAGFFPMTGRDGNNVSKWEAEPKANATLQNDDDGHDQSAVIQCHA